MAIDAVIIRIDPNPDGTATLFLAARPGASAGPGQTRIIVTNPPPNFDAAVGTEIWADERFIMVGDTRWAERLGYVRARLVAPKLNRRKRARAS